MRDASAPRIACLLTGLMLLVCRHAVGLALELQPVVQTAAVGDFITYDIVFDPQADRAIVGTLAVAFDPTSLELTHWQYGTLGTTDFEFEPTKTDGRLDGLTVLAYIGLRERGVLASVTFRVIKDGVSRIEIESGPGSWFDEDFDGLHANTHSALAVSDGNDYPLMRLSEDTLIGPVAVGDYGRHELFVHNEGTGSLQIDSVSVEPPLFFGIGFSIEEDGCSGRSVEPRGRCAVTVNFTADRIVGSRVHAADVKFVTSDIVLRETQTRVSAEIAAPYLELAPLAFFEGRTQPPYRRQRLALKNSGHAAANVAQVTLSNFDDPPAFRVIADGCSHRVVDVASQCELEIEFAPGAQGRWQGQYRVVYDAFSEIRNVVGYTATGLGVIDYNGPQEVVINYDEEAFRRVTLTNKGPVPLNILSSFLGGDFAVTVLDTNCLETGIEPGGYCHIDLRLAPFSADILGLSEWNARLVSDSFYERSIQFQLRVYVDRRN